MQYGTDNVFEAVWIGCTILAYEKYLTVINKQQEIGSSDFWFTQSDIQCTAQKYCLQTVQPARISQWTNGDHKNHSYKYLRENGKLRRLSAHGEFTGRNLFPMDLSRKRNDILITEVGKEISIGDLIDWFTTVYSHIFIESSELVKNTEVKRVEIEELTRTQDTIVKNTVIPTLDLKNLLVEFLDKIKMGDVEIYNESGIQHELALFIRSKLDASFKTQLERNIRGFIGSVITGFLKKEMDIVIFNESRSEKYCIELKFPTTGLGRLLFFNEQRS